MNANEKLPWRPWGFVGQPLGKGNKSIGYDSDNNFMNAHTQHQSQDFQRRRRVAFTNFSNLPSQIPSREERQWNPRQEKVLQRNLQVSQQLMSHFKPKAPPKFVPEQKNLSETHSSFRVPGKQRPIPIRHSGYKTIVNDNNNETDDDIKYNNNNNQVAYEKRSWVMPLPETPHPIDSDTISKIHDMRSRILAGQHVSMSDIADLKVNLKSSKAEITAPDPEAFPNNYKAHRRVPRRLLFCEKGIVNVPTPNTPAPEFNSFGTPADLRISLSNSDTAEYRGRRRFFFDFTGFLDQDIKLYLEGRRRLVIRGERPERYEKAALKVTDYIDLPKDLPVDNLRIVRDVFGTLIVEEAWKFL